MITSEYPRTLYDYLGNPESGRVAGRSQEFWPNPALLNRASSGKRRHGA
jgi:hypothetical protein